MTDERKLSPSLQDYLATIHRLQSRNGRVRAGAIAELCGVHKSSVTQALHVLAEMALIEYEPYGAVTLTDEGKRRAERIIKRYELLREFLVRILNVEVTVAERAARAMQCIMPDTVLEALARHIEEGEKNRADED